MTTCRACLDLQILWRDLRLVARLAAFPLPNREAAEMTNVACFVENCGPL